jgi:hypothetical protein
VKRQRSGARAGAGGRHRNLGPLDLHGAGTAPKLARGLSERAEAVVATHAERPPSM